MPELNDDDYSNDNDDEYSDGDIYMVEISQDGYFSK